jgi:hypothetical protein
MQRRQKVCILKQHPLISALERESLLISLTIFQTVGCGPGVVLQGGSLLGFAKRTGNFEAKGLRIGFAVHAT